MARITTKTGIANITASLMKVDSVSNIDPPDPRSKFAKKANVWYDTSRRDVLADHIWNFAETEVQISAESTNLTIGKYANRYTLPPDYIRIVWLNDEEVPDQDYKIKNGFLYTNAPSPITMGYIFDQEDITKFSPKFIQTLARKLKANMAYDMTGNRTMQQEAEAEYIEYLSDARGIDAQESPPTHKIRKSKWRAAKEGRGLVNQYYQGRVVT